MSSGLWTYVFGSEGNHCTESKNRNLRPKPKPNLINKPLEPKFEHQKGPQAMLVVLRAADVLLNQTLYRFRFEQSAIESFFGQQGFTQEAL